MLYNIIYSTMQFIEDISTEMAKIVPKELLYRNRLPNEKLSILLGQKKSHIDSIRTHSNKNPHYTVSYNFLESYKINIKKIGINKSERLLGIIEGYVTINKITETTKLQIFKYHPNFDPYFFKDIITKEKAYWLGFFFADGWISKYKRDSYHLGFYLQKKDEIQILRFSKAIGLESKMSKNRNITRLYKGILKKYKGIQIRWHSMARDLLNLGFKGGKTLPVINQNKDKLEYPLLKNRELDLAFLLGFYDGEGYQGRTRLTISSKILLIQIKEKYNLIFNIYQKNGLKLWTLSLGPKLMNEMQKSYHFSLPRKRKKFHEKNYQYLTNPRFIDKISKEELQELSKYFSMAYIAKVYKVNPKTVKYWINKWNI